MKLKVRKKGHNWERTCVRQLQEIEGHTFRNLEYREGTHDIDTPLPFSFECKCQARPNIWKAVQEVLKAKKKKGKLYACALIKRSSKKKFRKRIENEIAVLPIRDFLDILKEWYELVKR